MDDEMITGSASSDDGALHEQDGPIDPRHPAGREVPAHAIETMLGHPAECVGHLGEVLLGQHAEREPGLSDEQPEGP